MKRAKDRWIRGHLAMGLLFFFCLVLPSVSAARATSLFRTTTTTTTAAPAEKDEPLDGVDPSDPKALALPTPPPTNYTGIPQIDYIHDPNLPRELNGYNLSSYPFYETVPPPEEMDFKCDGLHDGFYASVPQKCQVYHHCIHGTRYDFLCANYTAFDQKTFICQFVSQVDCANTHKYYHRNDALYIALTTSTAAPLTTSTTTTTAAPVRPRGSGRRRPANRRPRPQYEYYDDDYYPSARDEDYYEEERRSYGEGRRRRKRPRPRRPLYDEYEDDRYNRRPSRNRDEVEDDYDDRSYDRPKKPSRQPSEDRSRPDSRRHNDDEEASRPYERTRKPSRPSQDERRNYDRTRRPYKDEESRFDKTREGNVEKEEKNIRDERPHRDERPMKDRPFRDERPRNDERRNRDDNLRSDERSYADNKKNTENIQATAGGSLVKPSGGSLFSKPRVPPKIARPVPTNEKEKYKYVTISSTESSKPIADDEEYYDEYETEDPKTVSQSNQSPTYNNKQQDHDRYKSKDRNRSNFEKDAPKRPQSDASEKYRLRRPEVEESKKSQVTEEYVYEEDTEVTRPKKPSTNTRERGRVSNFRKRPTKIENDYYYEDEKPSSSYRLNDRQRPSRIKYTEDDNRSHKEIKESSTERDVTTVSSQEDKTTRSGYVRVIKRPFLPSRGGSPYLPRGLQPLGGQNFNKTVTTTSTTPSTTTVTTSTTTTEKPAQPDYIYETEYEIVDDKNLNDEGPVENYSEEVYHATDKDTPSKDTKSQEIEYTKNNSATKDLQNEYQTHDNNKQNLNNKDIVSNNRGQPQNENTDYDSYRSSASPQKDNPEIKKFKEKEPVFRPSPQFTIPPKPTIKPYSPKIPENISIKQNLADSIENDYDVTINDALNPTLPNLAPIRNFPSPFSQTSDRDYTFSRFRNSNYPENSPQQYNNFQFRNQQINSNPYKYSASPRAGPGSGKNPHPDATASASEPIIVGVSLRTPQSFYIPHPRYSSSFAADDTNSGMRSSHVMHRHVNVNDYYV